MSNFEDKEATKPGRPQTLFDVVLVDVPPANRMRVIDSMVNNDYYPTLSLIDAMVLVFRIPSVVMHCCELKDAVVLEMIFEMNGAVVQIRPAKYCGDTVDYDEEIKDDTKELTPTDLQDVPDNKGTG